MHGHVDSESEPQVFGKYLLLRRVAVGGMAEIFLAVEDTPHAGRRFVTVKRIRPDLAHDPDYRDFFITEGRVSLKCSHPNLTQAYELGVEGGIHYLAMEFIRGHTLLDIIRKAYAAGTPLSVSSALSVAVQAAAALEHAHTLRDVDGQPLRVIHRDVTPQNIMVSASGEVKLIDFGIVRASVQAHETRVGTVKGKFSYMSPEQLAGTHAIDQRCDIWALGVCMHESLTGRSLFRGKTDADTLRRVRSTPVPDLSRMRADVPPQLAAVVAKALERNPDRRFQNATELLAALEGVAEECGIYRSVTRLRDEVLACCGDPAPPMLGAAAARALGERSRRNSTRAGVMAPAEAPPRRRSPTQPRVSPAPTPPAAETGGKPRGKGKRPPAPPGRRRTAMGAGGIPVQPAVRAPLERRSRNAPTTASPLPGVKDPSGPTGAAPPEGEGAVATATPPPDPETAPPAVGSEPRADSTGVAADADLVYFLGKAGHNVSEHDDGVTKAIDPELARLLSRS